MAEMLRGRHPEADVRTTAFEDWEPEPAGFGLALAAQSFHWLDRETRYTRIAGSLRRGGVIAIVRNSQVVADSEVRFFENVQHVYLEHAPQIAHEGEFRREPETPEREELDRTNVFAEPHVAERPWSWSLGRDDYLGLLSTHSPHASLDDGTRERLLNGIGQLIDSEFGGHVTEHHVAVAILGRRR